METEMSACQLSEVCVSFAECFRFLSSEQMLLPFKARGGGIFFWW